MNKEPLRLVELIGPAGAGKSTLLRELRKRHHDLPIFADRLRLGDLRNLPFYLKCGFATVPSLLASSRQGSWPTREELSRMFYLMGMDQVFQQRYRHKPVVVIDQGPIFELTQLTEFGPFWLKDRRLASWWAARYRQWAPLMRLVIWLDAPDERLIPRIRMRSQAHIIKHASDAEAHMLLARYRAAFQRVMKQMQTLAPIPILTVQTDGQPVDEIAKTALQRLAVLC